MLICPCCGLQRSLEELNDEYPEEFDGSNCPECDTLMVDTESEEYEQVTPEELEETYCKESGDQSVEEYGFLD